jgi:acetylornithine deacetylase
VNIFPKDFVSDLLEFMTIESISGNEELAAKWLHNYLVKQGFQAEMIHVTDNRYNVVYNLNSKVIFCSHTDTVPPHIPPAFIEVDGLIKGRGACDAKGVIISQILTAKILISENILKPEDIGFAYVIGEEADHIGAIELEKAEFKANLVLIGEPTENVPCTKGFGLLKLKFFTEGISGHSAFPNSGRSAIHELIKLLSNLDETTGESLELNMGRSMFNIGIISGGEAGNVHASSAEAVVLYRLTEPSHVVISRLERLLSLQAPNTSFEIITRFEPILLTQIADIPVSIARFNSDAVYFLNKADDVVIIGPGDIKVAHGVDEHIIVQDIIEGIKTQLKLVKKLILKK